MHLCGDVGNLILRYMSRWYPVVASAGMFMVPCTWLSAQPAGADGTRTRCSAAVRPFDAASGLTSRADSGHFLLPLASRDAVRCEEESHPHGSPKRLRIVFPSLSMSAAGGIPDSRGDGAQWAGRGLSAMVRTGVTMDAGAFHLALAPELWSTENRSFDILPSGSVSERTDRSSVASPFYYGAHSLDLPSRMGVAPVRVASPGQSALWLSLRGADLGVSSSNLWWGPGLRDGLLLGPGAPGIPRVFVRTARPQRTRLGNLSGEWFIGTLTESRWFDADASNDRRTLGAARIEWSPTRAPRFVLGGYRAVQRVRASTPLRTDIPDVWRSTVGRATDQMAGIFASYTTPAMRAFVEVVSPHPPAGIRALLATPGDDRGYQMGVERRILHGSSAWLLHAEVANTDPGISIRDRPARDFYAGDVVPHGWTHRGQMLGAGIGPGGNSQWVAVDRVTPRFSIGGYAERVRWNNEALTRLYLPTIFRHDVTARAGARGNLRASLVGHLYDIAVDASWGTRFNYLFQNTTWIRDFRTVDVRVPQLRLTVSPR